MPLNESMAEFVSQGLQELNTAQISFGLKLLVVVGVGFLLNTAFKTGGSVIEILLYLAGLIKWVIYKIMKKDI